MSSLATIASPTTRLLRLSPALLSSMTLMFALDEHLIFGTWAQDPVRALANDGALPTWWTRGGLRWRWVLVTFYPALYVLGALNLLLELPNDAAATWYAWGLLFSVAHAFFAPMAVRRIAAIEKGVPRGNVVVSMEAWLRMNWVRAWITDFPAWLCFIIAALKAL